MVRTRGGAAVMDDVEDLTATQNGVEDDEDYAADEDELEAKPKRQVKVLSADEQGQIFEQFRAGNSLAGTAKEVGIKLELLGRWLTRGGFEHSNSRMAQAARVLPPEEPFYTFAREAEAAWNEGSAIRDVKAPARTPSDGTGRVVEFDQAAADTVLDLIGKGATLNTASRQAQVSVSKVLSWLRAGAYPMIVPTGRRITPEQAQEPYKGFAESFQAAEAQGAA